MTAPPDYSGELVEVNKLLASAEHHAALGNLSSAQECITRATGRLIQAKRSISFMRDLAEFQAAERQASRVDAMERAFEKRVASSAGVTADEATGAWIFLIVVALGAACGLLIWWSRHAWFAP